MSDLNVVHASQLAMVTDSGAARRGPEQGELNLVTDAAVAIRDGRIAAAGATDEVLGEWGGDVPTLDARGMTVLPGLIECHSHALFAGSRHAEYARRLAGASLREVAAEGGGIWSTVRATREASDAQLLEHLLAAYRKILAAGVTTRSRSMSAGRTRDRHLFSSLRWPCTQGDHTAAHPRRPVGERRTCTGSSPCRPESRHVDEVAPLGEIHGLATSGPDGYLRVTGARAIGARGG